MTEAERLQAFTVALLEDQGAEVREEGTFLWATLPEDVQDALDLPAHACLTFDPNRIGEFDAELVAPGSYLIEKLFALGTSRGRWEVSRLTGAREGWIEDALRQVPALAAGPIRVLERDEGGLALFAYRTTLTSDEKREGIHVIAVTLDGAEGWEAEWPIKEEGLQSVDPSAPVPDLMRAERRAREVLLDRMTKEMEAFRKASLVALEEEVRRIFRYFDGTIAEVREVAPSGVEEIVRAIEAERDRRLTEAVERFEPHAEACLCSVRLVFVPTARAACRAVGGQTIEVHVDALTRCVRGLHGAVTGAEPSPPRVHPLSGTPRRRRTDGRVAARSPPGSRARSRSGVLRHRGG